MSNWDDWDWILQQQAAQQAMTPAPAAPMMGIPGQGAAPATPAPMANYDWANLTPLGRQLAIAAGGNPSDGYMTSAGAGYAPGYFDNNVGPMTSGGQYSFAKQNLTNWSPQMLQNNASPETGSDYTNTGWSRFMDANGKPMAAFNDGTGIRVFPDPGDFGGTGFSGQKLGKMAGVKYDKYDASGNYIGNGTFSAQDGWRDENIGDALGVGSIFAMAAGGALAAGAGAAGGAAAEGAAGGAAGAGAGAAGASDLASLASAYGGGGGGLSGWSLGGMGNELAAQGIINSGAGLAGDVAAGAAGGAVASGGGGQASVPAAFNPAVDSQLASSQLGITGTQAGADAAAAAIPSVTVNGAPAGGLLGGLTSSGGAVPGAGDVGGGTLGSLGSAGSGAGSLIPGVSNGSLLGAATTALGGLAGSQSPAGGAGGAGGVLDPRMEPFLYGSGGLLQQTQNTLNQQQPLAQAQSAQLASVGSGLLTQPIAGNGYGSVGTNVAGNGYGTVGGPGAENGFGKVQMADPSSFMNPYYGGMANDMQRRTQDMLGQSFNDIGGHSVGVGGLGGSRQGVAQGSAIGKAADSLQGNLAGLGGSMYQSALSGALNKYGTDTNFYNSQRGQDLQGSAQAQAFYNAQRGQDIAKAGQDQAFYGQQRGQDQAGAQLGGSLLGQSQTQAFAPLTSASGIYKPYTGLASSAGDNGTNWQGVVGGLLGGAQLAKNAGWW